MIFSVYDYVGKNYQYYEVNASTPPTAWFRRAVEDVKNKPDSLFCCTEVLAVRLPPGAKQIGTGSEARGVVATTQSNVGSADPTGDLPGGKSNLVWFAAGVFSAMTVPSLFGRSNG